MKILIDMNLSPDWVGLLKESGHEAVHWSTLGPKNAPDREVMAHAKRHASVIFTHDLDFGAILATTDAVGPSVIQVRTQNVHPNYLGPRVLSLLKSFEKHLQSGALISVDEALQRVRILPITDG